MKIFSRFRKNQPEQQPSLRSQSSQNSQSSRRRWSIDRSSVTEDEPSRSAKGGDGAANAERRSIELGREAQRGKAHVQRDSFEMVKRRVRVPLAIIDKPLTNEAEFIVDVRYRSLKVIGSGSFGVVARAIDGESGEQVAIKKIVASFSSIRSTRYVLREIRLLRHLRHLHIVRLLDIDVPAQYRAWDDVYIITPLLHTDVRSALNDKFITTEKECKRISWQLLSALNHMHQRGLMHRDIKTRNLLLDSNKNVQLCDLGHSRFYSKSNKHLDIDLLDIDQQQEPDLSGAITTMIQSAPEIALGAPYDVEVDIWAAGCVIAELVHPEHKTLFDNTRKNSHLQEILEVVGFPSKDDLDSLPDHAVWFLKLRIKSNNHQQPTLQSRLGNQVNPQAVDLLTKMLTFSPDKRISAQDAMAHPWFDDIRQECETLINNSMRNNSSHQYDFATSEPTRKCSKAELKKLVWNEIVAFHPEARSMETR